MEQLSNEVDRLCEENNLDGDFYRSNMAVTLVQALIKFETDRDYTQRVFGRAQAEYVKYPIQTLYEGCGDCEDVALLIYGLLTHMGYDCKFTIVEDANEAHAIVLVKGDYGVERDTYNFDRIKYNTTINVDGEDYYWVETITPSIGNIGTSINLSTYNMLYNYVF